MIDFKNLGQYQMKLRLAGTLSTTGVGQALCVVPFNGFTLADGATTHKRVLL